MQCASCSLKSSCTQSPAGRSVAINQHEAFIQVARLEQTSPEWIAGYRANRPLVERKIAHLVRSDWGRRRG
ncbi:MAG TPA: transposase [Acidimicrobiales bacterium]|nr:transposase [Acidimicrobiales bacterium]